MMPNVATTANQRCEVNVPTSTRNSLTNVDKPGSDSADRPAIRNIAPSQGATFDAPPKSSTSREPRRVARKPTRMNRAPVENAWLTMYSVAPEPPCDVKANTPSAMNPKGDTDEYATSRFMSRWPIASRAPYRTPITHSARTYG